MTFCSAVRRLSSGTPPLSSVRPLKRVVGVVFSQVKPSTRNLAKFWSRAKEYWRFCLQDSNDVIVSVLVKDHCLGARIVAILILCFFNVCSNCIYHMDQVRLLNTVSVVNRLVIPLQEMCHNHWLMSIKA